MSSDTEDTIELIETAPAAPQSKRPDLGSHLKERIVATKTRALAAKAGEHPAMVTATSTTQRTRRCRQLQMDRSRC